MNHKLIPFGICLFLLSPCIALLGLTHQWSLPSGSELIWALTNSTIQAFCSALLTLFLGFWVALSHIRISKKNAVLKSMFEALCLVTQFIPVVVSLVGIMNFVQPFPMGIAGMVTVHGFLNFGLAAILLSQTINSVWSETADVARTLGVSRFSYWIRIGVPQIKKDIFLLFLYFFSSFFTSFSVPLIVGGGWGTTLEILIYEKMRLSSDWSEAIILSWVQMLLVFALSILAFKRRNKAAKRTADLKWLGSSFGYIILVVLMAALFVGYSSGLSEGWIQRHDLISFQNDLIWGFVNSILLGLITFVLVTGLMKALVYVGTLPEWLDRFLNGYLAPSTSLTCFAFLLLFPAEHMWSYMKIPVAFVILSFPALYRMGFGERLKDLKSQQEHAALLGATSYMTYSEVLWPQIKSQSRFLGALVATWACGDFAVSRILSTTDFSLGLIVQTLLSTYRMSLASIVSVILLVACLTCFFIITGWDYVDRRKS